MPAVGAILMQQKKLICYHSKKFSQALINYPTYDKELYALAQSVKKWKHYLIGKETIIHTDHQPLQYLQSQTWQVAAISSFQVDGFSSIVSYGNKV